MSKIVIVDYGLANLRSVQKAFEKVGADAVLTSDPKQIADAEKLVLPGVGAFRDAIANLKRDGLDELVRAHVQADRPFLGICLGLQLLFTESHEDGIHQGLNLLPGTVTRFKSRPGLKIPHMGWNTLRFVEKDCPLFEGLPEESAVYFVHGYHAVPSANEIVTATADYPDPFCAVVWEGNVFATQFHPEKSQAVGLRMLKNFANIRD